MYLNEVTQNLQSIRKKCIVFAADGNTVVQPYKTLYSLEEMTNDSRHQNLFIEVKPCPGNSHLTDYYLFEDIGVICRQISYIQNWTINELAEKVNKYKYFGIDGFFTGLRDVERSNGYINKVEIAICGMLGKSDLVKHYTEYRENRLKILEEKRQQQEAERIAKEEAEEKARLEAIENQINTAINAFKNHTRISNDEIDGKSIILYLMKKYGVKVPLKTQGWINNALACVCWNENGITYRYYTSSRNSTVFLKYLKELEEKITA